MDEFDHVRGKIKHCSPKVKAAILAYVKRVTKDFPDKVQSIILYGSQARGDARQDADIDLFIIINQESPSLKQELNEIAWQVQFTHNVIISDIIRTVEQFQQMTSERFPYYNNLENEGILLWKNTFEPMPTYV
jgi:uncharacterized protein